MMPLLIISAICINLAKANASTQKLTGNAWNPIQEAALIAPDSDSENYMAFGNSVLILGESILIGSPGTPDSSGNGKVYIANKSNEGWSIKEKIEILGNKNTEDGFGYSIAASGNTLVIGAPYEMVDGGVYSGAVYVYNWSNGGWSLKSRLTSEDPQRYSQFGETLAISDGVIAIGSVYESVDGKNNAGAVYVFNSSNNEWSFQQKIIEELPVSNNKFGKSIAFMGDILFIGSYPYSRNASSVFGFKEENGSWYKAITLESTGNSNVRSFGYAMAASKSNVVIASENITERNKGYFYVFNEIEASNGNAGEIMDETIGAYDLPPSISTDGDTLLIGNSAAKAVYPFTFNDGLWEERPQLEFKIPEGWDVNRFGYSSSVLGNIFAIGAPYTPGKGSGAGSVFIFNKNKESEKITPVPASNELTISLIALFIGAGFLYSKRRRKNT